MGLDQKTIYKQTLINTLCGLCRSLIVLRAIGGKDLERLSLFEF
jgi:hypothetical protein